MSKRRAYSARKSVDIYNSFADSDYKNTFDKSCGSASNVSSRAKYDIQKKYFENLLSNFSQECIKMHSIDDQKLFLHSSQILEKLNKILNKVNDCKENNSQSKECSLPSQLQVSLKKVVFYRDVLTRLLKERCSIIMNEECNFCIKQTQKLCNDLKNLYINEKLKMRTMPIQTFNRFMDSSDINVNVLKFMLKRIQMLYDLYFSLRNNYRNIINISCGLDMEFFQALLRTMQVFNNLKINSFYWAKKILNIFLKKICLADSNAISPEYLQEILNICEELNLMFKNKSVKFELCQNIYFDYVAKHDCKTLPQEQIMHYLSHYEAKVASKRIVNFLVSECKRNKYNMKRKSVPDNDTNNCCNTSDYCSTNASDFGSKYSGSCVDGSVNLISLLSSLIQRNQTLVIKYLYCTSNLKTAPLRKSVSSCSGKINSLKKFQHSLLMSKFIPEDDEALYLEDKYWLHFWNKLLKFVLISFSEKPYHQYGNETAGIILLWPESFLDKVSEILKLTMGNEDISTEGSNVLKQIHQIVSECNVQIKWNKKFSSALSAMHLHLCFPVPTILNGKRTYPGNLFCNCIELLIPLFCSDAQDSNSFLYLKSIQELQVTLDSFLLWTNTKTRALVACGNLSTYLVICCFDCKTALSFFEDKTMIERFEKMTTVFPTDKTLNYIILKQIDFIEGYLQEAPCLIHLAVSNSTRKCLSDALKLNKLTRAHGGIFCSINVVEHILKPLNGVINKCSNLAVVSSVVLAVSQTFLSVLYGIKKPISSNRIQILNENYLYFVKWIFHLELRREDVRNIQHINVFHKLGCIMRQLEISNSETQNCLHCRKNRVSSSQLPETHSQEDQVLNEEERMYWRSICQKKFLICC